MKSDNCGDSRDCSGKGVCYSNVSMVLSTFHPKSTTLNSTFDFRKVMNVNVVLVMSGRIVRNKTLVILLLAKIVVFALTFPRAMKDPPSNVSVLMVSKFLYQ